MKHAAATAAIALIVWLSLVVSATAHVHESSYRYTRDGQNCRTARIEVDRHGVLFGGELWFRSQRVWWCVSHGYVTWSKVRRSYGTNAFWEFKGNAWIEQRKTHYDRHFYGLRSHFAGTTFISKVTGVYENNWPQITMTVWGDLHYTFRAKCGC